MVWKLGLGLCLVEKMEDSFFLARFVNGWESFV